MKKKLLWLGLLLSLFLALHFLGIQNLLSLEKLKQAKDYLQNFQQTHFWLALIIYFFAYVLNCVFALPGAAILTLAGGAIFGIFLGVIMVSLSSVAGASASFLLARFLFRDWVERKFRKQLLPVQKKIEEEGLYYLIFLRMVPAFPFFLVNILVAQTKIAFFPFAYISFLTMLPATVVFVNAGTQLAKIESTRDVLSANLIFAFVLLGILPLLLNKVFKILRGKANGEKI